MGKEDQPKQNIVEKVVENDRYFLDPNVETLSFVAYCASYMAFTQEYPAVLDDEGNVKEKQTKYIVDEDFNLTIADCSRRVSLYFGLGSREEVFKSLAKIDRLKAAVEAIEDNLTRAKDFMEAHPEYFEKYSRRGVEMLFDEAVTDKEYDKENGEWKRGTIKRRE
jgi:predicted metallo-beta-lactamase superfamily hydrolase